MKIKDRAKPKMPPIEPGVYIAICVGVIDLGEQYNDKFKSYSNKVQFVWEIPDITIDVDGEKKPRQISKDFTVSSSKKSSLRAYLSSWNGKTYTDDEFLELDIFDQIGKPCQLQIALNETGEYANVDNLMQLPKGFPVPTSETKAVLWDMEKWNDELFSQLPEWVQDKIKKSTQYQKEHAPETVVEIKTALPEKECPI